MTDNSTNSELLTTIVHENDSIKNSEGQLRFVLVPIGVLIAVMILTLMVCLMVRRRKLDDLRHRLMPLYNFDKTEQELDWETELLNNFDNPNYTETSSFINSYD